MDKKVKPISCPNDSDIPSTSASALIGSLIYPVAGPCHAMGDKIRSSTW